MLLGNALTCAPLFKDDFDLSVSAAFLPLSLGANCPFDRFRDRHQKGRSLLVACSLAVHDCYIYRRYIFPSRGKYICGIYHLYTVESAGFRERRIC